MYPFDEQTVVPGLILSPMAQLLETHPVQWRSRNGNTLPEICSGRQSGLHFHEQFEFIHQFISKYPDMGLGLKLGEKYSYNVLGSVGQAVMSSPNLGAALNLFARYMPLLSTPLSAYTKQEINSWIFGFQNRSVPLLHTAAFFHNYHIGALLGNMRFVLPQFNWTFIKEIRLGYPKPEQLDETRKYFNCTFKFGYGSTEIEFQNLDLAIPLATSNAYAEKMYVQECEKSLERLVNTRPTLNRVYEAVLARITQQTSYSIEAVSEEMCMSSRTLRRKLKQDDATYQQVVSSILECQSKTLLVESSQTIEKIAGKLGYSDISAFSTAFKRWTGYSPQQYRGLYRGSVQQNCHYCS